MVDKTPKEITKLIADLKLATEIKNNRYRYKKETRLHFDEMSFKLYEKLLSLAGGDRRLVSRWLGKSEREWFEKNYVYTR